MEEEILKILLDIQNTINASQNNWTPMINTLIGGVLALTGSFTVQVYQQRSVRKKEQVILLRNKLDEIGQLANDLEQALQQDFSQNVDMAPLSLTDIPPVFPKLQTLLLNVNLYHEVLAKYANSLEEACKEYNKYKLELFFKKKQNTQIEMPKDGEDLYSAFEKCLEQKKIFLAEVIKASSKLKVKI